MRFCFCFFVLGLGIGAGVCITVINQLLEMFSYVGIAILKSTNMRAGTGCRRRGVDTYSREHCACCDASSRLYVRCDDGMRSCRRATGCGRRRRRRRQRRCDCCRCGRWGEGQAFERHFRYIVYAVAVGIPVWPRGVGRRRGRRREGEERDTQVGVP